MQRSLFSMLVFRPNGGKAPADAVLMMLAQALMRFISKS